MANMLQVKSPVVEIFVAKEKFGNSQFSVSAKTWSATFAGIVLAELTVGESACDRRLELPMIVGTHTQI